MNNLKYDERLGSYILTIFVSEDDAEILIQEYNRINTDHWYPSEKLDDIKGYHNGIYYKYKLITPRP